MSSLSDSSILAGGSGAGESVYTIDQSIRFNASDTAYLNRTPSSAGNQKTWTLSWWFKRGNLSTNYSFFNRRTGSGGVTNVLIYLMTDDRLQFYLSNGSSIDNPITTRKFRDTAAWYHCVATLDTTNSVTNDRFRVFINGVRETLTGDTFLYDTNYLWNDTQNHAIGRQNYQNDYYLDAYMAEIVFIDGTSLNADSFGEYNSSNIWIPKDVSTLTFGTNGFHIDGRNSSALGQDEAGSNDFAISGGLAAHDQVLDSPTNNFCVMSPIDKRYNSISEGNLKTTGGSNNVGGRATMGFKSGQWYWEMYVNTNSDGYPDGGIVYPNYALGSNDYAGGGTADGGGAAHNRERWYVQSTSHTAYGSAPSSGDIYMYALDRDNNKIFWGVNGTWRNSGDPAGGTGAVASGLTHYDDGTWMPFVAHGSNAGASVCTFNFGQEGTFAGATTAGGNSDANGIGNFKYAVPNGYLALCTKNLGS